MDAPYVELSAAVSSVMPVSRVVVCDVSPMVVVMSVVINGCMPHMVIEPPTASSAFVVERWLLMLTICTSLSLRPAPPSVSALK